MIEELEIAPQSLILLVVTGLFLFWLVRYAGGLRREAESKRLVVEEDMADLEDVSRKLEENIDDLYKRLDSKVDQVHLELKLEELERKRAELIRSAIEARKKAQASIELMAIFTLLLVPIAIGFMYSYTAISDSMNYKAAVVLDRIGAVAEKLYVEGPGASALVYVDVPSGVDHASSYIGTPSSGEGRYLSINQSGSESFRILDATVSGEWPNTTGGKVRPGFSVFNLTVNSSGTVRIQLR
ncbi:MAG: hypothetical protein ABIG39_06365 [Candidatus Micrarchaeota archaeon]